MIVNLAMRRSDSFGFTNVKYIQSYVAHAVMLTDFTDFTYLSFGGVFQSTLISAPIL